MDDKDDKLYDFDMAKSPQTIIKVIGVGGGGGNAVSNMYREGIRDVSFVLCNTDNQALQKSEVPDKLLIGQTGLGAGDKPERGEAAALESEDAIRKMLDDGTKMAFITAGMGGGTGTGAGPVVAKISKEMGILTVGIVTIPYLFEGRTKIVKALRGVRNMKKNVDSLLVINNQGLMKLEDMTLSQANELADKTLTVAARSIAEIVTTKLEQNVDFADVDTTMRDSGVALISIGYGEGEGRLQQAIEEAIKKPLICDLKNISNAKRIAFVIYYSHDAEIRTPEISYMNEFMSQFQREYQVKWGHGFDDSLGQKIKITILATGFDLEDILSDEQQGDMDRYMTEEEMRAIAEREEAERKKREEEDGWMKHYYGDYLNTRSNAEVVVLSLDELDDDRMIAYMEEIPAYKRTAQEVAELRGKGKSSNRQSVISRYASSTEKKSNPGNTKTKIIF